MVYLHHLLDQSAPAAQINWHQFSGDCQGSLLIYCPLYRHKNAEHYCRFFSLCEGLESGQNVRITASVSISHI